jgi:hypothetical protein
MTGVRKSRENVGGVIERGDVGGVGAVAVKMRGEE